MVILKDLWIGDDVKVISSGRIGKFEGIHANGKAKIKSKNQLYLVDAIDLESYIVKEVEDTWILVETKDSEKIEVKDSIDLHIEILNPNLKESMPERILDYQVKAFEAFLQSAKKSYKNEFIIIHGKGTGVLKNYIMSIIKNDKDIKLYNSINDGGAVKILL